MRRFNLAAVTLGMALVIVARGGEAHLGAQLYPGAATINPVDELNRRLREGTARLTFEGRSGYLRSTLDALDVPVESQMLVFSQTSLLAKQISPSNPRAIFFNDTVQVGFVRGGEILEIATQNIEEGVVFFTLDQRPTAGVPQFRSSTICLSCHKTRDTLGMPGLMTLNTLPQAEVKLFATGTVPDHRSAFEDRWGGWYVTGSSGAAVHRGNQVPAVAARASRELASVDGLFDTDGYLSTHSDVAALMVFLHQTRMTNLISRIAWEARDAQGRARTVLVAAPGENLRVADQMRDITAEFVDYLLFVDELKLAGGIKSLSGFVEKFSTAGPRDSRGRSLRELDLSRRLMRYPCSYLIYSAAFDALPALAKESIYARMWQILSGEEQDRRYTAALSPADRRAIVEILRETKKDLPAYFSAAGL